MSNLEPVGSLQWTCIPVQASVWSQVGDFEALTQGGNGLKQKPCEVHGSATQCNAVSVVPSPILEGTFGHSDADKGSVGVL